MITLRSDRLVVEIAAPGAAYAGARFDWTAFITQVTLDGRHTFCVPEAVDGTGTGGAGLCNEFGIFDPVGYEDAVTGEQFPKFGVGLLRRPDLDPYRFSRAYEITAFPLAVEARDDEVMFVMEPLECRGYAGRLQKRVQVAGNRLTIDYRFDNVGTRPVRTNEYVHNFIGLDSHPVGPGYELHLPFVPPAPLPPPLFCRDRLITWSQVPANAFFQAFKQMPPEPVFAWQLVHRPSGLQVAETTDVGWSHLHLYGTSRLVSPEAFVALDLAPGQTKTWQRSYAFAATASDVSA